MRILLILITIFLFSPDCIDAQPRYINKFINKHKNKADAFAFTFPGWLIKKGGKIATKHTEGDPDAQEALKLLKYVKKMRMIVIEENNPIEDGDIQNLMMKMKDDSFEDYIIVRHKENRVNFMAREKNNVIKDLVFFVNADDTFVLMTMKTNITVEQLEDLDLKFLKEEKEVSTVLQ
jgi:hypothetical protein